MAPVNMQVAILGLICLISVGLAQDSQPVCTANQIFNGQACTCAPGYFTSESEESRTRCADECEEVYYSWFTKGKCVSGLFERANDEQQPPCNLRCGMRIRVWAAIALLVVIAAAICTLVFTIPMCIATCSSCLHARKANKNSKKIYVDHQSQSGVNTLSKEQQMQAVQYNPYSYWPYYGRG